MPTLLPQYTAPYLPVTIGLLSLIMVLEIWTAAHRSVERMRLAGTALAGLKMLSLACATLAIWFLGYTVLRSVIVGSLIFCGGLTLYREFRQRWQAGDRSWASLLGGIAVVIQFLSLIVLAGAVAGSLLTLLLGPIQALRDESLLNGLIVAWVENFTGILWLVSLYYGLFYLIRRVLGGSGFSWLDPPNWRTLLPHLKYTRGLYGLRSTPSRLADTVRMAYTRSIVSGDVPSAPLEAVERAALIRPLPEPVSAFTFAIIGDPGEGDRSQINPWLQQGQIEVFQKAMKAIDTETTALRAKGAKGGNVETPGFLIISSDIVYPAGELMDYERALYRPYRSRGGDDAIPIYAIPGNHDWYNNLKGFFLNFGYPAANERNTPWAHALRHGPWGRYNWPWGRLRWREVALLRQRYGLNKLGGIPGKPATQQRLPFFEMAFPGVPLTILGVDTGCSGSVDPLERAWLRRRLHRARARGYLIVVLLSEPVYVNGAFVTNERLHDLYSLLREYEVDVVMGGDTHAYQHYEVRYRTESGRIHTAHHFVNGGGGAYLSWPMDFTWRMAFAPGLLDRAFVYSDPAGEAEDEVTLHALFPTAADMRRKFKGSGEGNWLRRKLLQFEPLLLDHGLTNALDHDRPPPQQSFITARMARAGAHEQGLWELRITPWFSDAVSGELLSQQPITLRPRTQEPIWSLDET
ncbi:MAG: hypothetical protein KatS3mg057_1088 [Herpetosiphonaceae bacterium]|nr:MAG: hypothetical protein KatS3mg057_1088 [Herpetosiphonaceae bacterium]